MPVTQSDGEKQSSSVNVTNEDDLRLVIGEDGTSLILGQGRIKPYSIPSEYSYNYLDLLTNILQIS